MSSSFILGIIVGLLIASIVMAKKDKISPYHKYKIEICNQPNYNKPQIQGEKEE